MEADSASASEQRAVVDQATGIVLVQFEINSDAALEKILHAASEQNRMVYELASEIVERNEM